MTRVRNLALGTWPSVHCWSAVARPRLLVPGDGKGGRYVSDVTTLRVIHAVA